MVIFILFSFSDTSMLAVPSDIAVVLGCTCTPTDFWVGGGREYYLRAVDVRGAVG
jgi:hypothetical protein